MATKNYGLVTIIATSFLYVEDQWLLTQTLCSSREPYWKIYTSKTLNMRKEDNPSFCFAVSILSHRKTPCLKSSYMYNALQTLVHWLRHVCLCIVLLTCKGPSYRTFILVSGDQTFAFDNYFFIPPIVFSFLPYLRLFFTNHYLLAPFLKHWPLNKSSGATLALK